MGNTMGKPRAWAIALIGILVLGAGSPASTDAELEKAIADPVLVPVPSLPLAVPTIAPPPLPLVDIFSADKNPGRGTFELTRGGATEKIVIGPEAGHYVMGMVFSNDVLPDAVALDFKNNEVIQLAFGTLATAAGQKVGQFGASTLMVARGTHLLRLVPLRIPGPSQPSLPESGFLLFNSAEMASQQADDEKLKGTFFAKAGSISLSPATKMRSIQVTSQGRKVPFRMQGMRMELLATLITPFNNEEAQLRGTVEFPLYWPDGPSGKRVAKQLADASFNAKTAIRVPDELGNPKRALTGQGNRSLPRRKQAPNKGPEIVDDLDLMPTSP